MQKYVTLVDLVKIFPTTIYLQRFVSIQPRTSLSKFAKKSPTVFLKKVRTIVGYQTYLVTDLVDADERLVPWYANLKVVQAVPPKGEWPPSVVFLLALNFDSDYGAAAQAVLEGGGIFYPVDLGPTFDGNFPDNGFSRCNYASRNIIFLSSKKRFQQSVQ